MIGDAAKLRAHQQRWARFRDWEEAQAHDLAPIDLTARLHWCDEALALVRRSTPVVQLTIDDEQLHHWRLIRRRLPRRLPAHHGAA